MIVPGGGARERLYTAVELIEDGACGKVLFTGNPPEGELDYTRRLLASLDPAALVSAPFTTGSTVEDAIVSLQVAREQGFLDLLVVTSPYHTLRVEWIFERVLAGSGVRFGVQPSDAFYMDYRRWWVTRYGRSVIPGEYLKLWMGGAGSNLLATIAAARARA